MGHRMGTGKRVMGKKRLSSAGRRAVPPLRYNIPINQSNRKKNVYIIYNINIVKSRRVSMHIYIITFY